MKAYILATGHAPRIRGLTESRCAPMLPLLDRPFLQHIIERLVSNDITDISFLLSGFPEQVETFFSDGTRWGAAFEYHLVRNPEQPLTTLKALLENRTEPVLLLWADRLPVHHSFHPPAGRNCAIHIWRDLPEHSAQFAGTAVIPAGELTKLNDRITIAELEQHLLELSREHALTVSKPLYWQSYSDILQSAHQIMDGSIENLMISGRPVNDNEKVWLARNVVIHPTAAITPPIYIGEGTRIEEGVSIGPYAAVGPNCVLDSRSTVTDSIILRDSYIGERLEINRNIIFNKKLVNVNFDSVTDIPDNFILGNMTQGSFSDSAHKLLTRFTALLLLIPGLPILLLTWLALRFSRRGGAKIVTQEFIELPAPNAPLLWKHRKLYRFLHEPSLLLTEGARRRREFLLKVIPGLISVAAGSLHFAGVPPRKADEIEALPADWRELYLGSHAGIISEPAVVYGHYKSADEAYATEAYYAVQSSFRYDCRLIWRYFTKLFTEK